MLLFFSLYQFAKGFRSGSDISDAPSFVALTPSGNYAVRSCVYKSSTSEYDGALFVTDTLGNLLLAKQYGWDADHEYFKSIAALSDGYVLAGYTESITGGYDAFVLKTDLSGTPVWSKVINYSSVDMANFVLPTSDGGYLVVGETYGPGGGSDALILKLSSSGSVEWAKYWGGDAPDQAYAAAEVPDGYLVVGYLNYTSSKAFVLKLGFDGSLIWSRVYEVDGGKCQAKGVVAAPDGIYITGQAGSYSSADALVIKTDASGSPLWARTLDFGGNNDYFWNGVYDNGLVVTGTARRDGYDATFVKLSSSGTLVWARAFDYSWDEGYNVVAVPGGYVFGLGAYGHSLIVLDSDGDYPGCIEAVSPSISSPSVSVADTNLLGNLSPSVIDTMPFVDDYTPSQMEMCSPLGALEARGRPSLQWRAAPGGLIFTAPSPMSLRLYSPSGQLEAVVNLRVGRNFVKLKPGVYLWKGGKGVVR